MKNRISSSKTGSAVGGLASANGLKNKATKAFKPPALPEKAFLDVTTTEPPTAATILTTQPEVTDTSPEFWVPRINAHLERTVVAIIGTGSELIAANEKLKHGQWQGMFEPGRLRIGKRSAQVFMAIARNQVLANTHNYAHLPPALNSLNALASVEPSALQSAIVEGKVTPGMSIREVKQLAKSLHPQKALSKKAAEPGNENSLGSPAVQPSDPPLPADLKAYFAEFRNQTKRLMTAHPNHAFSICVHAEQTLRELHEFRKTLQLPENNQLTKTSK